MSEQKNISDLIREYIFSTHQKDNTYFSSKSSKERNADFKSYCQLNPKLGLDYSRHRALLSQILTKNKKEINLIESNSKATSTKSEKFKVTKGDQQANVTVNPKQTTQEPTSEAKPSENAKSTGASTATVQTTTNQQGETIVLHPPMCQCGDCRAKRGELSDIDAEEAGSILEIIIEFWHSRNPRVTPMTEQEVLKVGKRLKPILQRHLGGDLLLYGFGLLGVAQVVMDRWDESKGDKKDSTQKKIDKANEKTSTEKPPEPKQETPEENETVTTRKFFNKRKISEVEAMGAKEDD